MPTGVEHYRQEWSAAHASLPGARVGWIDRARREALDRFCGRGFPTPRDEDWKYTNVRPLERRAFRFDPGPEGGAEGGAEPLPSARRLDGLDAAAVLVFRNGVLASSHSGTAGTVPDAVRVESLAGMLESDPERVEPFLSGGGGHNAFSDLNRAFLAGGAFVSIGRGVQCDAPVELVFESVGESDVASHPLVLVLAEADSAATIVEHHLGAGAGTKLANPFTRIAVGERAAVEHHLLLEEDESTWHTGNVEASVAAGGRLGSNAVQLGGRLVRYGIDVSLDGAGATVILNGLYVARGRQHVDFHTRVDHREPGGTSEQVYKGLLDGHGRGVFNGRVLVHLDAQHSDASQSNHNLLLSPDAEIDTKPQLEIFADDVKCSHGATVGQLDERAVHYLRSRGLGEDTARALLTFGFADDVLARMGLPALRRHVERGLAGALPALAGLPPMDSANGI
ncbi:MAG: Fe-S cluster assembly protein SufD [Immundisolibacterales bacterium]|nr:Fe-S cluster assembly protein SufD [Immundisolibacterales bacterium]